MATVTNFNNFRQDKIQETYQKEELHINQIIEDVNKTLILTLQSHQLDVKNIKNLGVIMGLLKGTIYLHLGHEDETVKLLYSILDIINTINSEMKSLEQSRII